MLFKLIIKYGLDTEISVVDGYCFKDFKLLNDIIYEYNFLNLIEVYKKYSENIEEYVYKISLLLFGEEVLSLEEKVLLLEGKSFSFKYLFLSHLIKNKLKYFNYITTIYKLKYFNYKYHLIKTLSSDKTLIK